MLLAGWIDIRKNCYFSASAAASSPFAGLVSKAPKDSHCVADRFDGHLCCVDPVDFRLVGSLAGVGVSLLASRVVLESVSEASALPSKPAAE